MTTKDGNKRARTTIPSARVREHFLGWQCRVRQHAVRHAGGRPSPGMRPHVIIGRQKELLGPITMLIIKREPEETTAQFRHMAQRTHDPGDRYDSALRTLAAAYYQRPEEFSDEMTALFGPGFSIASRLLKARHGTLDFEQYNQRYQIPCTVSDLPEKHPAYQATYWHNSLFNPAIPSDIQILAFRPDWRRATADPPIGQSAAVLQ